MTSLTPAEYRALALPKARGRQRTPGTMNSLERNYSQQLELRKAAGEVLWWGYEVLTWKLAPDTRYTPDFLVLMANTQLECHETKGGFTREDSWIKLKLAASLFPVTFRLVKFSKAAGWTFEEVGA